MTLGASGHDSQRHTTTRASGGGNRSLPSRESILAAPGIQPRRGLRFLIEVAARENLGFDLLQVSARKQRELDLCYQSDRPGVRNPIGGFWPLTQQRLDMTTPVNLSEYLRNLK